MRKIHVEAEKVLIAAAEAGVDLPAADLMCAARTLKATARRWGLAANAFYAAAAATIIGGSWWTTLASGSGIIIRAVSFGAAAAACVALIFICDARKHATKSKELDWTLTAVKVEMRS